MAHPSVHDRTAINNDHECKCCGAIDIMVRRGNTEARVQTHCRQCSNHSFPCKILEVTL